MQHRPYPEQQPQDLFQQEGAQQHRAQPELEASILRFWETIRTSADTIVTLRQENARLKVRAAQAADTSELRAEIAGLKADTMTLRAANEQYQQDIATLRVELSAERSRQPVVVESPVNAELQAELELLRQEHATVFANLEATQAMLAEEQQREPVVVESPVNAELLAETERLREAHAALTVELEVTQAMLAEEQQREPQVVESPVNAELLAETERLRAAHAAVLIEVESMQVRLADELSKEPTEPVLVESPINQELEAEIEQLRADLAAVEVRLVEYTRRLAERDDIIIDLQATVKDLQQEVEAKTAALAEPIDADHERELLAIEALQERLRELEPLAIRHREQETQLVELQTELADVNAELQRAMTIVQRYREAGLRHLEHPDMAGQMTLFMPAAAQPSGVSEGRLHAMMTKEEVLALADRLDSVANRIGGLFGIS